jgi:hypothetical protein
MSKTLRSLARRILSAAALSLAAPALSPSGVNVQTPLSRHRSTSRASVSLCLMNSSRTDI